MQVRTTRHIEADDPDENGVGDHRYEYDITVFSAEGRSLVARSYSSTPDEAHFLRAETGADHRQLTDDDMRSSLAVEAAAYLRAHGKSEINWLNNGGNGYEVVRAVGPFSPSPTPRRSTMSKLRVESFTISLDGFGAGPDQDINNPLGVGGTSLHGWALSTRTFQKHLFASDGGAAGMDDDFAARGFQNIGAWILGRNMFGPVRGPWPDESWRGWWGENPVYHVPVFVLTHHARAPLVMEGGTTFHFVTEGIDAALAQARKAAGGKDVRLGGGVSVIQQCLRQRLIDEMHIAISPILLGAGERLFEGVNLPALGYACTRHESTPLATHVVLARQ